MTAAATDAATHKKMFGSGTTTLIISNEEMVDTMKMVKYLEDPRLLIKDVSETIKNEARKQKGGFLNMLLGTLGSSLLGNLLTSKSTIRASEGVIRGGQDTQPRLLLTNFKRQMYHQNEPRFNSK